MEDASSTIARIRAAAGIPVGGWPERPPYVPEDISEFTRLFSETADHAAKPLGGALLRAAAALKVEVRMEQQVTRHEHVVL